LKAKALNGKEAKEVVDQVGPKIVLPMHYKIPPLKIKIDDEKKFCREIGICPREKVDKLILKKKDLSDEKIKVVLMNVVNA